ncbi:MAG: Ppx/GppA phosphatase family protein [Pseudomonadota bacterium]
MTGRAMGHLSPHHTHFAHQRPTFAAIDLGTNNCRLLVAVPQKTGFRVVDAYSQIVRLGEGVAAHGRLSEGAMDRTLKALTMCAAKMEKRGVTASRSIATQACRVAQNGPAFLDRIEKETGLPLEVISPEEEAALSVKGCQDLIDSGAKAALVFDIGGGSTELSWLKVTSQNGHIKTTLQAWTSLPYGVVSVAETYGQEDIAAQAFDLLAEEVAQHVAQIPVPDFIREAFDQGQAHLVGTSGTVTSLAGIHLKLEKYNRQAVDGLWLSERDIQHTSTFLRGLTVEARAHQSCIGQDRADLVVPGCAILAGIMKVWPAARIRVGDRGLREGVLMELMEAWRQLQSAKK